MHAIYSFLFSIVLPLHTLNDTTLCLPFRLVSGNNDIFCLPRDHSNASRGKGYLLLLECQPGQAVPPMSLSL